jgi:glyoxylase-like metal-dependent hydrolase (beta-lactamase superfamily II)
MLNKSSLNGKVLQSGSVFSVILLATSLLSTSNIQNSKALIQEDHEDYGYLKLAAYAVKQAYAAKQNNTVNSTTRIPAIAMGPQIPAKGYLVQEIRDHLYWVTDGAYNTMFLVSNQGVIVVDAPFTIGKNYLKAIAEVTKEPVKIVIYSHAHMDHIVAASMFPANATYIAQQETATILKDHNDTSVPAPTVTFSTSYAVRLGNQTLVLDYKGVNHERGNIFIYAPTQRVLMLVDVVFPGWVPFRDLALAEDVPGFIKAHEQALSYPFDTLVAGHLTRLGTRQDVVTQMEFVNDLKSSAINATKMFANFTKIAEQVGGFSNPWLVFKTHDDDVANQCTQTMLAKWNNRLGGANQYMSSHCAKMAESLRVD